MKKNYFKLFPIVLLLLALPVGVYVVTRNFSIGDVRNRASGEDVFVTIDPSTTNASVGYGAHLNLHPDPTHRLSWAFPIMADPDNPNHPSYKQNYIQQGFSYFRTGLEHTNLDWTIPENRQKIHDTLDYAQETGSDVIWIMNIFGVLDPSGQIPYSDPAGNDVPFRPKIGDLDDPDDEYGIVDFVQEFTIERKQRGKSYIKYYELGNEEWGVVNNTTGAYLTPIEYIDAAKQISTAIREVAREDSEVAQSVKILGVSNISLADGYGGTAVPYGDGTFIVWGAQEYADNADYFDYVTYHGYWHDRWASQTPVGDSLLSLTSFTQERISMYKEFFPNTPKFQIPAITEWNLYCWNYTSGNNLPDRAAQTFEHTLYNLGFIITALNNNVPFTIFHNYVPIDCTESGQYTDRKCCCSSISLTQTAGTEYESNPAGYAFELLQEHFGLTYISTTVDTPLMSIGDFSDIPAIMGGSSKNAEGTKLYTILINRKPYVTQNPDDPQNSLSTNISINGHDGLVTYTPYTLKAPDFTSSMDNIQLSPLPRPEGRGFGLGRGILATG